MPKLWADTIETHRRDVTEAILDATEAIVAELGLIGVTMSGIAEGAGIGRATLYKYFPDLDAVLRAWHERQIRRHLGQVVAARDAAGEGAADRLEAVLDAYASVLHEARAHDDAELAATLHGHRRELAAARRQLHGIVRDLIAEAAAQGGLRDDVSPTELATYCIHSLAAAAGLPSRAAVRRLVVVTLDALRAPASPATRRRNPR